MSAESRSAMFGSHAPGPGTEGVATAARRPTLYRKVDSGVEIVGREKPSPARRTTPITSVQIADVTSGDRGLSYCTTLDTTPTSLYIDTTVESTLAYKYDQVVWKDPKCMTADGRSTTNVTHDNVNRSSSDRDPLITAADTTGTRRTRGFVKRVTATVKKAFRTKAV
ncbi:hypothetical protein HDU93_002672 [Gonapodya sp. JEL0774]|nr:hypothetical protein HDU93_002672 [Gonapodya sp. JEL0774]